MSLRDEDIRFNPSVASSASSDGQTASQPDSAGEVTKWLESRVFDQMPTVRMSEWEYGYHAGQAALLHKARETGV